MKIFIPFLYVLIALYFFFDQFDYFVFAPGSIDYYAEILICAGIVAVLAVSGTLVVKGYGWKNAHSKAALLLILGSTLKIIWGAVYLIGTFFQSKETTIFNPLHILGLASYTMMIVGLAIELKSSRIIWTRNKIISVFLQVIVISVLVVYLGMILPGFASDNVFFVVVALDLLVGIMAVMIFALVNEYRQGAMAKVWIIILFSFVFALAGDIIITNFFEGYSNSVWPFNNLDIFWFIGLLLLGQGVYKMRLVIDEARLKLLNKQKQAIG